jgi:glycine/D-amino acid oxidase-like deaminating enzyme
MLLSEVARLPSESGYVSLWLDEAISEEDPGGWRRQELPPTADVVIAGGGFTGLWTAIRLLEHEPQLRVCLIEAKYCGYGASGRNGGIADASWAKFPVMVRLFGEGEAIRLARMVDEGLPEIERFCERHGVDAQIRHRGNLWAASNRSQLGAWIPALRALEAAGQQPFREVDGSAAEELSSSPALLGGIVEEGVATLQPARLVRGLRRVAIEMGVTVVEQTAMTGFEAGQPVRVQTSRGPIVAGRLVLAMNAWAAGRPELRGHLFVTSSDIGATTAAPELLGPGLGSGIGLADSRRMILYWRSTPDGRVVFGKGGGFMSSHNAVDDRFTGSSPLVGANLKQLHRLYPGLRDASFEYSWNGPIDYSVTGLPYFGPLDDRTPEILVGAGYSGNGIVPTVLGGRILASLALGLRDEYSSLPVTRRWSGRLPPEPFRSWGAPIVRAAISRKESTFDQERSPGPITSWVASLDPTASPTQS